MRRLWLPALLSGFALLAPLAVAHPGNVVATLTTKEVADGVGLEAVLTFDGTGEPLLGATLSFTGPGAPIPEIPVPGTRFDFGGGPHVRVATLPKRAGVYTLHILSLGETTAEAFTLSSRGGRWTAEPREVLLVFPDVGLPSYQLALVVILVVVGMVVIVARGPSGDDGQGPEPGGSDEA